MIHRADHKTNYTRIDNDLVRNNGLSDGAFRLLVFILSCSDNFDFSIKGLCSLLDMPRKKVMKLTNELKTAGYIRQERHKDGKGHFGIYVWDIYEVPEVPKNGTSEKRNLGTEVPKNGTSAKPNSRKRAPIRTNKYKEQSNIQEGKEILKKADSAPRSCPITSVNEWLRSRETEEGEAK